MNEAEFFARLEDAATGVDGSRWALAELALDCKAVEYEHWAEKIGRNRHVGRAARTVRQWAQVAEFRHAIGNRVALAFSFYAVALRYVTKLPTPQIVELMGVALAEDVSLEEFAAELRTQAGRPEAPPPDAAKLEARIVADLGTLLDLDGQPQARRDRWTAALDAMTP